MHKLLKRQLQRYRGSLDIPEDWRACIEAIDEAYQSYEKDYLMIEHNLSFTSRELCDRNDELEDLLKQLKESQMSLIHSEKMAGLGNLIAGISHEINTPASAISSAIVEIDRDYVVLLEKLINILDNFPREMCVLFQNACKNVLKLERELTTVERRQNAKVIFEVLDKNGIPDARGASQNLALIGFTNETITPYIALFKTEKSSLIVQSLYELGMGQIHVHDISIAISRISFQIKALKSYTHSGNAELLLTDLRDDINNTLVILHNKLKRAVKVTTQYEEIPKVKCYADQLNQVWTNLINNAIEAMHGEGVIAIRMKMHGNEHVIVEIEDNGPGISRDVIPKIFDPYFTTKPKGEGTGLGLSISKKIIEQNQGTITVESEPGKTVFRVIVPIDVKLTDAQS